MKKIAADKNYRILYEQQEHAAGALRVTRCMADQLGHRGTEEIRNGVLLNPEFEKTILDCVANHPALLSKEEGIIYSEKTTEIKNKIEIFKEKSNVLRNTEPGSEEKWYKNSPAYIGAAEAFARLYEAAAGPLD